MLLHGFHLADDIGIKIDLHFFLRPPSNHPENPRNYQYIPF